MKILIWLACIFVYSIIVNGLRYSAHIILGGIPTAILVFITFGCAMALCKAYDRRKEKRQVEKWLNDDHKGDAGQAGPSSPSPEHPSPLPEQPPTSQECAADAVAAEQKDYAQADDPQLSKGCMVRNGEEGKI